MDQQIFNFQNPIWPVKSLAKTMAAWQHSLEASQDFWMGYSRYANDFLKSYMTSMSYWMEIEREKAITANPQKTLDEYTRLGEMNQKLFFRAVEGAAKLASTLGKLESDRAVEALFNTLFDVEGDDIETFMARQAAVVRMVARDYPEAIEAIEAEYGFHFEKYQNGPFAETDRFVLYRIEPTDPKVTYDKGRKPLIIIPPYVLGANVLSFLPKERRSYAHSFANQGIPTYIRLMKNIHENEAVQTMECEDDTRDTKYFLEKIKAEHGLPVTLNGYCQGGYSSLCNLLSGELDGLVDTLITCVSPMDGTYSDGLSGFLGQLPPKFNDLEYGIKRLPNGNRVADGRLMGWVYKLKSIENENPVSAFYRDLLMFAHQGKTEMKLNKSAVAINYWLSNERTDLPLAITEMSFTSYNTPISEDGTLPVKLFGRKLNLKRLTSKGIKWLICYGEKDDLVEKECALEPAKHVDAEITEFPRGHVAIATSWSHPESSCALHTRFGKDGRYRGPVLYHLDVERELKEEATKTRRDDAPHEVRSDVKATTKKPKAKATAAKKASKPTPIEKPMLKPKAKATPAKKAAVKPTAKAKTKTKTTKKATRRKAR